MHRWKTLVVDDLPEISANLEKQLTLSGHEVRVAQNFTEAQFLIEHYDFELAILDIFLPDGNGIDVYRKLREKNPDIYTIMITGNATVESAVTALNEGVNAYLVKPFSNEQLRAMLVQGVETLKLRRENHRLFNEVLHTRQFYEDLLNSSSEAILVVDLDFRIQYCNNSALKLLHSTEEQLQEQPLHTYMEDGYKVLSHLYQQLVLGKPIAGYRVGIKTAEEKSMDAHITLDFLQGNSGLTEGLIVNLSNTMIHNEVFNRILRKEKLSTIIKLANTLSHEIRNPINILYGRLQLLAEEFDDANFRHAYESIQRQIDRLLNITGLLAKFNFSREDSIPELFSVIDLLKEVLNDSDNPFRDKKDRFRLVFERNHYQVEGNHAQFADAFRYLLEAILEFTPPEKQVEICAKMHQGPAGRSWLELRFTLPDVQLSADQLFDPYQAIDMKANGLVGLGMTIMQTIFTNYGARIDSHIQDERDTMLRIRFPLFEGELQPSGERNEKSEDAQKFVK